MKTIILLLFIPFLFLSAESKLKKKKLSQGSSKKTNISKSIPKKKPLEITVNTDGNIREEIIKYEGIFAKISLDKNENPLELLYLKEESGKYYPRTSNQGYSKIKFNIDREKYSVKIFNKEGKLEKKSLFHILSDGWEIERPGWNGSTVKEKYDANGFLLTMNEFGKDKKLITREEYEYDKTCPDNDKNNCRIMTLSYGSDDQLKGKRALEYDLNCKKNKDPALGIIDVYCRKLIENYGPDGKLKSNEENIARTVGNYDEKGNLRDVEFFNSDRKLVKKSAGVKHHYDAKGNLARTEFYGEDGKPGVLFDDISIIVYEYDENCLKSGKRPSDCESLIENLGIDGKPIKGGIFSEFPYRKVNKYDEKGNLISQEAYGADGNLKPVLGGNIIARKVFKNDDKGNRIVEENYTAKGDLLDNENSYSRKVMQYDYNCIDAGNSAEDCVSLKEYYGRDGKLMSLVFIPEAKTVSKFNQKCLQAGNPAKECISLREFYGADGMLVGNSRVARIVSQHDENGNIIQKEKFRKDGKLIDDEDGIAKMITKYDTHGNKISSRSFTSSGITENWKFFPVFLIPSNIGNKVQLNLKDSFEIEDVRLLKPKKK